MIKTIKGRIIVSFVTVFVVIFSVFGYTIFSASYNLVFQALLRSSQDNLDYFQSNINRLLNRCETLSDSIYYDRAITRVMIRQYDNESGGNIDRDLMTAIGNISSYIGNDVISGYVNCIILHGNNGQTIRYGHDADYFTIDNIESLKEFEQYKRSSQAVFLPITTSPSAMTYSKQYIQLLRGAISLDSHKNIGWQYMAISTSLIEDAISDYNFNKSDILLVYDNNSKLVFSNNLEIGQKDVDELPLQLKASGESFNYKGNRWLMVKNHSDYSGLTIIQLIDYKSLQGEISLFLRTLICVFVAVVIIAVFMAVMLSNLLTKPIQNSIAALNRISNGDFSVDVSLEGNDEIGKMGCAINSLAINIDGLMKLARKEERQKKELEYKMLQNQINPHFVYNVLNSIKVMAQLQGADNITRLVDNFGGLLKEVSKGVNDKVTVQEECELADKYIYLYKLRKKGLIQVSYDVAEECKNALVLKLLLQPLIENAIVHGFEGRKGMETLAIKARRQGDLLQISLEDNGVGMTPEEIDAIFDKENHGTDSKYNSIGINNVQERIKLLYGNDYGLAYESEKTVYTRVTVTLPFEQAPEAEE